MIPEEKNGPKYAGNRPYGGWHRAFGPQRRLYIPFTYFPRPYASSYCCHESLRRLRRGSYSVSGRGPILNQLRGRCCRARVRSIVEYMVGDLCLQGSLCGDGGHQENIRKAAGKEDYWRATRLRTLSWSGLPQAG
jgi:hypothetical protein